MLGDPEARLDLLHSELRALEAEAASAGEAGTGLLEPALALLREELRSTNVAAAAASVAEPERMASAGDSDVIVFYQSEDGQLIFPDAALTKQLLGVYGNWSSLPACIKLRPLHALKEERITDWLMKRHKFLGHLPADAAGSLVYFAHGVLDTGEPKTSSLHQSQRRSRRQGAGRCQKTSEAQDVEDKQTAKQPSAPGSWDKMPSPLEDSVQDAWSEED